MINSSILKYFIEDYKYRMIELRETCHHWIDYEILDALQEELKQKYIDQFEIPTLIYRSEEKKFSIECKSNHLDAMCYMRCDCSEYYPKTLKESPEFFLAKFSEEDEK
jgi:hypothetical protein